MSWSKGCKAVSYVRIVQRYSFKDEVSNAISNCLDSGHITENDISENRILNNAIKQQLSNKDKSFSFEKRYLNCGFCLLNEKKNISTHQPLKLNTKKYYQKLILVNFGE